MIIEELNQELKEAVKKFSEEKGLEIVFKDKDIEFEISDDIKRAHFSSSSPLKLAKFFKTNPLELAKDISEKITSLMKLKQYLSSTKIGETRK